MANSSMSSLEYERRVKDKFIEVLGAENVHTPNFRETSRDQLNCGDHQHSPTKSKTSPDFIVHIGRRTYVVNSKYYTSTRISPGTLTKFSSDQPSHGADGTILVMLQSTRIGSLLQMLMSQHKCLVLCYNGEVEDPAFVGALQHLHVCECIYASVDSLDQMINEMIKSEVPSGVFQEAKQKRDEVIVVFHALRQLDMEAGKEEAKKAFVAKQLQALLQRVKELEQTVRKQVDKDNNRRSRL
mmetsp:Transcript_75001/g.139956  ORF Transcript_75001/g.139956 Transcript_75001/m.139956 type:complete len:241 (-) Transcript_75001:141-863(-)